MKLNAATRLTADASDAVKVEFTVSGDAKTNVPKLLALLAFLGSAGASRTITIDDVCASADGTIPEGDIVIGFDGDGPDKITDILVDGKQVHATDYEYTVKDST